MGAGATVLLPAVTAESPFFVFGGPGLPLAFPTQGGQPVCVTQAEFEECCCGFPTFFAGTVSGVPQFNFNVVVDVLHKFAYVVQNAGESGPVIRIDLASGRIDALPISAAYGLSFRPSDSSLFCYNHRTGDSVLRRYLPHLWNPGDALPAQTSGAAVNYYSELSTYSPSLDAILIPKQGEILSFSANTLSSPSQYMATGPSFGVHGLRWEDEKTWWIEGDQSAGRRWAVGASVFTTGPTWGSDIVPFPDLGRAVLVGHPSTSYDVRVVDASTGAVLYTISGLGASGIGGCYRWGNKAVIFDYTQSIIRTIDVTDGSYVDTASLSPRTFTTGFVWKNKRISLPYYGANWGDLNCGLEII